MMATSVACGYELNRLAIQQRAVAVVPQAETVFKVKVCVSGR